MATESVLQAVQHYQRSIEKNSGDVARLLHCVGKLYKLPITVGHLQETGVGRTVNALRKHNGELGVAAEAVVNKWKEIVASENDSQANEPSSSDEDQDDDDDDKNSAENVDNDDDNERNNRGKNTPTITEQNSQKAEPKLSDKQTKETTHSRNRSPSHHERHDRHKSNHKDKERSDSKEKQKKHHRSKHEDTSSSNGKEKRDKSESSSNHKRRRDEEKTSSSHEHGSKEERESKRHKHKSSSREDDKKSHDSSRHNHKSSSGKHKSHDKHNDDKDKEKSKSKSHSSSHSHKKTPTADTTSPPTTNNATASTSSKRRHEDSTPSEQSPKKQKSNTSHESKRVSKQPTEKNEGAEHDDDGIDSSMGANFADVLGMLNMPQKKAKKSLGALKTSPTSSKGKSVAENGGSGEKTFHHQTVSTKLKSERDFDGPSTSTQVNLEKKPILLNSNVKLAPLDPSIALELPVISNNYKPLPLNPTVMDCVFNSSTSSSSRAPPRLFSDAEALSHGISSKTIRTKVYSGVKSGQLFQVPTLFDLCIRVLQKNIDAMEYTGGVPFDVLRPVLERATPQQLFLFEQYNPYVMEDSDVLWQLHVQRTYRGQKRQEMESWREMFMRCQEEQERRLSMLAQNIKHSQKVMAEPVRKTQLAFVDSMVKPPRSVMRKQEQYGTKAKLVATPAARVAALSSVTPNAAKTGDVRLRTAAAVRFDPAQAAAAPSRPKKAPLMAKTLQFIRGRHRR